MGWRLCVITLLLHLAAALPGAASAADYALLIGVSDYPSLPKRLWLRGPTNDVALMRDLLLGRGFSAANIRSLVSRSGPGGEPTRANILQAMQRLVQDTQRGDRVVLYLAGHGSQQPQPKQPGRRPVEPDGLDEVFLPSDVQRWDGVGTQGTIANALLDDEIGEWIDTLVDRGALVWAVFDTCHAAGMARGPSRARWRAVSSVELGLNVPPSSARTTAPPSRVDGRVLLHAARTHELTSEEWLPRGAPMASTRMHGVFTYHLATLWRGPVALGAAQIEQAIMVVYRSEGRASPRPTVLGERQLLLP